MNEFSIWRFLNLSIELLESFHTRRIKRCNSQPASQLKTFLYSRIYFVFEKRMKKTVLAIVGVVLLVAVLVTATHRWGYSQYGAVYYYDYPFFYYDQVAQPPGVYTPFAYERPSLVYPSPLSSDYLYRYDPPSAGDTPRGVEGQLCGLSGSEQFGCVSGLVCDYSKTKKAGLGICSKQAGIYPASPSMTYPYYFN